MAAFIAVSGGISAQQRLPESPVQALPAVPYADYADLVLASPVIVDATVRKVTTLKGADALGVKPGQVRLYVEADVLALIRSSTPLPPRIAYVVDMPLDARGRPPKLRKARVLLFARPVPRNLALVQLVRPDAQRDWTPETDALTRQIVRDTLAADAPPKVTGIGNAFHVSGDLPGTGETQIFLTTENGRPVSLGVEHQPGQPPRWSVALSEIVDQAAGPPARNTLLWYRLACALPPALPDSSVASLDPENARLARLDYQFILRALGPCDGGRP